MEWNAFQLFMIRSKACVEIDVRILIEHFNLCPKDIGDTTPTSGRSANKTYLGLFEKLKIVKDMQTMSLYLALSLALSNVARGYFEPRMEIENRCTPALSSIMCIA